MFDQEKLAFIQMVVFDFDGVFTDNTVYVDQNGVESVRCWRSDGLGLSRLREIGVKTFIISTEANLVVTARANKLKIACRQSVEDKSSALLDICSEVGVDPKHAMFVGNDINDIPAFKSVGFPVAVADAYPEVDPYIVFRTMKPGGFGAVREICDMVFLAKNGN
jgi:3-deoxy-D-manno-octulosonate 8-phosphate phosphatase (KDO 8-P phosphatase)